MNNLLLDTNALIWIAQDSTRLSVKAKKLVLDPTNNLYLSSASSWELSIKHNNGAISLYPSLNEFINKSIYELSLNILPIELEDTILAPQLPLHHKDPFDRMIIQHAIKKKLTILTSDSIFEKYRVKVVW